MVYQLQLYTWLRHASLRAAVIAAAAGLLLIQLSSAVYAADSSGSGDQAAYLATARTLYNEGQYFRSARYAFESIEKSPETKADAYSWITLDLTKAHLYNAATYFFIRTLQTGHSSAIRRVLIETQELFVRVGPDLLRKYLVRHTKYDDYDAKNRSAFLYSLGKDALLAHQEALAIGYLNGIQSSSALWPFALELKGSAHAILGETEKAVYDFNLCVDDAGDLTRGLDTSSYLYRQSLSDAEDLRARCMAGVARSYYQENKFDDADRTYDRIQKSSLVWPDILFEQAWNAFARQEYNRTLGKLVSYKSPALMFVFNPEIDVLRAQAYLALCLYSDANDVINEFNGRYNRIGEEVKAFVEGKQSDLDAFYGVGKEALHGSIYINQGMRPMLNQFVRGPYFTSLVHNENEIASERAGIRRFAAARGVAEDPGKGLPGFLEQVLEWRKKSVRVLGGMFVKNSLIDYHAQLVENFEKMAFIKLEMLKRAKDQLIYKNSPNLAHAAERGWGNQTPHRKDYQYYWSFNGEFWNDEIGDYVFGLESQCGKSVSSGPKFGAGSVNLTGAY